MEWNGQQLLNAAYTEARQRLTRAAIHLTNKAKEALSVPAPRRRVKSAKGIIQYVATTRAIPWAPPRKLSGRLRASVAYQISTSGSGAVFHGIASAAPTTVSYQHAIEDLVARVGTNVVYGGRHERGTHPWLEVTFIREMPRLKALLEGT